MQLPPGTKVTPFAARMLEERATAIMEDDANFMSVFCRNVLFRSLFEVLNPVLTVPAHVYFKILSCDVFLFIVTFLVVEYTTVLVDVVFDDAVPSVDWLGRSPTMSPFTNQWSSL